MKKTAFTLAETLITLGIIGIVAAMTLPNLIAKYQEKQYKVTYKKVYSSLNQSLKLAQESDEIDFSFGKIGETGAYTAPSGKILKYLSKYYNAKTTCFESNADKCWECDGEAGYLHATEPDWKGCGKNTDAFIDASGVEYYLYSPYEFPIVIDVNGHRKPNQLGRDRFVLRFADSQKPKMLYPDTIDCVRPYIDIEAKGRWCPQGNCFFESWINR